MAIAELNTILDSDQDSDEDSCRFRENFILAFNDLDSYYLGIVRARNRLYKHDTYNDPSTIGYNVVVKMR